MHNRQNIHRTIECISNRVIIKPVHVARAKMHLCIYWVSEQKYRPYQQCRNKQFNNIDRTLQFRFDTRKDDNNDQKSCKIVCLPCECVLVRWKEIKRKMIRRYLMKSIFDGNVVYLFVFGMTIRLQSVHAFLIKCPTLLPNCLSISKLFKLCSLACSFFLYFVRFKIYRFFSPLSTF